jgi:hypothetical protein
MVRKPDGTRERISGCAPRHINTKVAAHEELRQHIERVLHPERVPTTNDKEVMTFKEWFNGRFWHEWVVGRKNKPTEVKSKQTIYRCHLEPRFGRLPLDEITVAEIAKFRADLVASGELGEKRINNILVVLSKALRYAHDCELIAKVPKIGLFKVERPEIVAWDLDEYARLLAAAKAEGEDWYAAVVISAWRATHGTAVAHAARRSGEKTAPRWVWRRVCRRARRAR